MYMVSLLFLCHPIFYQFCLVRQFSLVLIGMVDLSCYYGSIFSAIIWQLMKLNVDLTELLLTCMNLQF